jgi:hypothetical protein
MVPVKTTPEIGGGGTKVNGKGGEFMYDVFDTR